MSFVISALYDPKKLRFWLCFTLFVSRVDGHEKACCILSYEVLNLHQSLSSVYGNGFCNFRFVWPDEALFLIDQSTVHPFSNSYRLNGRQKNYFAFWGWLFTFCFNKDGGRCLSKFDQCCASIMTIWLQRAKVKIVDAYMLIHWKTHECISRVQRVKWCVHGTFASDKVFGILWKAATDMEETTCTNGQWHNSNLGPVYEQTEW